MAPVIGTGLRTPTTNAWRKAGRLRTSTRSSFGCGSGACVTRTRMRCPFTKPGSHSCSIARIFGYISCVVCVLDLFTALILHAVVLSLEKNRQFSDRHFHVTQKVVLRPFRMRPSSWWWSYRAATLCCSRCCGMMLCYLITNHVSSHCLIMRCLVTCCFTLFCFLGDDWPQVRVCREQFGESDSGHLFLCVYELATMPSFFKHSLSLP